MSSDALAAVAVAPLTTELRRLPLPEVGPDDALLRIEIAGICGTDWEIYRRESRGRDLGPLILGHENVGHLSAVGDRAAQRWGVGEGDRVALEEFIPCGRCRLCRAGHYRLCDATDSRSSLSGVLRYGITPLRIPPSLWGGFAEHLYVHPDSIVHRLDDSIPAELAALVIPISNGVQWVAKEGGLRIGGSVLIQGPGQHGLGCVVAAHHAGASTIVVAGTSRSPGRLALARELGATHTVESDREDVLGAVRDITGGELVDLVVDLTPGAWAPVAAGIEAARKLGVVVLAGSKHGKPLESFAHDTVVRKELTVKGVRGHDQDSVEAAISIIASGRYPLERMCTHRFGLDRVDEALRVVGERTDPSAVHVSVVPH
jgi:threonine dehydrogenase-like Zn-dependent dehydrogenase